LSTVKIDDSGDANASSPNWERALCLSEPQANLGKEGEGFVGKAPALRLSELPEVLTLTLPA
jgi:hypothetical protein